MNDQFKSLLIFFASVVYFIIGFQVSVYIFNRSPSILLAFLFGFIWIGGFTFAIYWFKKPKKDNSDNSHSSNYFDLPERKPDQSSSFFSGWSDDDGSDSSDGGDSGGSD